MTTTSPASPNDQDSSAGGPGARAKTQIAIGMAAIIGVYTALGLEGDLFARLMRNHPTAVTLAFVLALLGVAAGLIGTAIAPTNRARPALNLAASLLLAGGAIFAVWVGVDGIGVRDQPTLHISPLGVPAGTDMHGQVAAVGYNVTASGAGLASEDRMLLRVSGFPSSAVLTTQQVWDLCSSTAGQYMTHEQGGVVLASNETGPSLTGTSTTELTVHVHPSDYRWVCAHAVLAPKPGQPDGRFVTTLIDTRYSTPSQ